MFEYCENTDFLISQPVNVLSNLAFLFIGLYFYQKTKKITFLLLPCLIFVSSSLWHLFETQVFLNIDMIVVGGVCLYVTYLLLDQYGIGLYKIIMIVAGLAGFAYLSAEFLKIDDLKTSAFFAPLMGVFLLSVMDEKNRKIYFISVVCLGVACFFRTIDLSTCGFSFVGTHWLWHLGTAASLFYLLKIINQLYKVRV